MRTLPTGLLLSAALLTMVLPMATAETTPADTTVQFGMDANGVAAQKAAGIAPDYGTFWIGPWTLSSGWGGPDAQLTSMKNAGVTPAIHFYYWGDDISPSCVENGCYSSLHNAQKNRAGWEKLGTQLTDHLNARMGGEPVVVFLESEFNKGGIEKYEPFDGYMADMAAKIHANYPNAIVVLGFGNWGSTAWGTFDRAAAESDMVGIQGMRGSTKQNVDGMYNLYEGLLAGVKTLETKFPGKPIMLTDIAVSSYPEPSYLGVQAGVLKEVLDNLDTLKAHGVEAMIYRSWRDAKMDPANYYGQAESHWGLAWQANGTMKESGKVWVAAVKAERSGSSPVSTTTTTTSRTTTTTASDGSGYSAKVTPSSSSNEWWVQVGVAPAPAKVEAKVGSGSFVPLNKESYGWAKSVHAAKGTMVQFRVTDANGNTATTPAQAWLVDMSAKTATSGSSSTTTTSAAPTTTSPPTTSSPPTTTSPPTTSSPPPTTTSTTSTSSAPKATVKVTPSGNTWWVQAAISSTETVTKVEAKAGSGAYVALDHKSYGWAKSFHVAKGTMVQFRVTASDGSVATTAPQAWLVDMSAKTASFGTASSTQTTTVAKTTTTAPATTTSATTTTAAPTATTAPTTSSSSTTAFRAYFSPKSVSDNTRVEVGVTANKPIAKVEAKVTVGTTSSPYIQLEQTSPGVYAKAMNAPDGAKVTFRATSTTGQTYSSIGYTWG